MQDQLKIPKTLKVGFQKRSDTYSGKLAFVVYEDKGKISKEKSWKGWISDKIPVETYENIPTEGFVLNKDVGGARRSYGWNPRMEKVRVYDPRGFEFEITTANLLFILQECSSIKGKGLEGQFVYSWDGKDIVLLPCSSENYQNSLEFTNLQKMKFNKKDLVEGCIYKFKNQTEGVYLGSHLWFEEDIYGSIPNLGKQCYVFELKNVDIPKPDFTQYEDQNWYGWSPSQIERWKKSEQEGYEKRLSREKYVTITSLDKIAKCLTDTPVDDYAEMYTALMATSFVSEIAKLKLIPVDDIPRNRWRNENFAVEQDGKIILCKVDYSTSGGYDWHSVKNVIEAWRVTAFATIDISDGKYVLTKVRDEDILVTKDEKEVKNVLKNVKIICKNGCKFDYRF